MKLLFTFTVFCRFSPHLYSPPLPVCSVFFHCIIFIPHPTCFFFFLCVHPHSSILSFVQLCLLTCLSAAEGKLSICHRRLHGGGKKQVQEVRAHVNTSLRRERERTCLLGTGTPVSLSQENAPFWAILVCLISCWETSEREGVRGEEKRRDACVHEAQLCLLNWIW